MEEPMTDYVDEEGFLCCGNCRTRKESMIPWPLFDGSGGMKQVRHRTLCRCAREKLEAEEKEKKRRDHEIRIAHLRNECFTGAYGKDCTFENADRLAPNIRRLAALYTERWDEMREKDLGYLFWGGVGNGKTSAAACIANALIDREVRVLMRNMSDFLGRGFEERAALTREITRCDLFILDDLGTERGTGYGLETVYNVVNARYESRKPMIVTTNLTLKELQETEDPYRRRIFDRVLEMCVPVLFSGESLRPGIRREKMEFLKTIAAQT